MSRRSEKRIGTTGAKDLLEPLTLKERKFLAAWLKSGNLTEAAKKIGKYKSETSASTAGHEFKKRILEKVDIDLVMESVGLSDVKIFKALVEGIQATSVKVFNEKGKIITSKPMIDWMARAKHLDLAARIKGLLVDTVKHGLDKDLDGKIKRGVVILPALDFKSKPRKNGDQEGEGSRAEKS